MGDEHLVTVELPHLTGVKENAVQNSFAFKWDTVGAPVALDFDNLAGRLSGFFNNIQTVRKIADYLSPELLRGTDVATIRFYDVSAKLNGDPHGSPVATRPMTLAVTAGGAALPSECAAVVTTRAFGWAIQPVEAPDADVPPDAKVDRPRQRYTGRFYLGPLRDNTGELAGNVFRLTADFRQDVLLACSYLFDNALVENWQWSVWSRRNAEFKPIEACQIDNGYDTQRRRGADASQRDTIVLVP